MSLYTFTIHWICIYLMANGSDMTVVFFVMKHLFLLLFTVLWWLNRHNGSNRFHLRLFRIPWDHMGLVVTHKHYYNNFFFLCNLGYLSPGPALASPWTCFSFFWDQ